MYAAIWGVVLVVIVFYSLGQTTTYNGMNSSYYVEGLFIYQLIVIIVNINILGATNTHTFWSFFFIFSSIISSFVIAYGLAYPSSTFDYYIQGQFNPLF